MLYDTTWETSIMLPLSSGKIDEYEYFTGEEILPSDQRGVKE